MSTMQTTPRTETEALAGAANQREQPALRPPVDVIEDSSGITLMVDMPGVSREALHLRVDGDQLHIEAQLDLNLPDDLSASHAEVQGSRYERSFTLGTELDAEQVSGELSHGVLKVRLPKTRNAQPRRIEIKVH